MLFIVEQLINSLQLGIALFLLAAGLTLVFGVMNIANLAHGSFFMVGAYAFRSIVAETGSYIVGILGAAAITGLCGLAMEVFIVRRLYGRSLLDQILATFAIILMTNSAVTVIWGLSSPPVKLPAWISGSVPLGIGFSYPTVRVAIILIGLACAVALYVVIARTRIGMLVRAGATNREFLPAMGVDVRKLYTLMFAGGAALAGIAGAATSPISYVRIGMGEAILVPVLIVLVIGRMGSIRGAFAAAMLVGAADVFGRVYAPKIMKLIVEPDVAAAVGASVSAMTVFVLMLGILLFRRES